MGFFADLKTKREAKKAQRIYQLELADWDRENKVLSEALEIFEGATKGEEVWPIKTWQLALGFNVG
jgi:hypothetical protein